MLKKHSCDVSTVYHRRASACDLWLCLWWAKSIFSTSLTRVFFPNSSLTPVPQNTHRDTVNYWLGICRKML